MSEPDFSAQDEPGDVVPLRYTRAKSVDLNRNAQGLNAGAQAQQERVAFQMGRVARQNGLTMSALPNFANDELIGDWISGWETEDAERR